MFGALFIAAFAYPGFLLINSGATLGLILGVVPALVLGMTPVTSVAPVLLSELFPTDLRYTAVSTSYQLAQTLGSGFAPLIAASLLAAAGGGTSTWLVAAFVVIVALLSAGAIRLVPETQGDRLEEADASAETTASRTGEPA